MLKVLKKIVGTSHERTMKRIRPMVNAIGEAEGRYQRMSNAKLKAQTALFREKLDNGASLDDLLIDAFAVAREGAIRSLGMRPFDVQMIGGIVLHEGNIAEMKTGEGKTLVAVAPVYLNALESKGVHVVTVNDYLAERDAQWMGNIYNFLDMSVGVTLHGQGTAEKKKAYMADITYGQNNEFGFDYLRDNMKYSIYDYAQKGLNFAIVDEVDSILIDESRTPLIISGASEDSSELYNNVNSIIPSLVKETHFVVDEKGHSVTLTEEGVDKVEKLLGISNLYDPSNIDFLHHVNQALKAHYLYKRDVSYMVTEDNKVVIIDEFTGRLMPGRRWSDGLHQAVEAKEHVQVEEENRTLATISFQNLFRLYNKLAGMTGTADTEAEEFHKTYKINVIVIPTNWPCVRDDQQDVIYKTEREKFTAIVNEILSCRASGQPVLVGTVSVEKSEAISRTLKRKGIAHNVLNAKHHGAEAGVVAQAGRKSAVTVSTNMAGRGTDIILGGNSEMLAKSKVDPEEDPVEFRKTLEELKKQCYKERREVVEAGGLHILGTERHESRRIDNQLRGRAGRQGDPGSSRFFLSLEDDLLRIFGAERLTGIMDRLGMEEGVPIEHRMVTKSIERAQQKVEHMNFDRRKHLLEYDDVMNQQRKTIYALRRQVLDGRYEIEQDVAVDDDGDRAESSAPQTRELPQEDLDRYREHIKNTVETMVRVFGESPGREEAASGSGEDDEDESVYLEDVEINDLTGVRAVELEHEIYRYYGIRVPLEKLAREPALVLETILEEVPKSLVQQRERLLDLCDQLAGQLVDEFCPENRSVSEWDFNGLSAEIKRIFNIETGDLESLKKPEEIHRQLYEQIEALHLQREKDIPSELLLWAFRDFYLREIDKQWIDHLQNMDSLRDGIRLRAYGNKDPKKEYKKEGYGMFVEMVDSIQRNVLQRTFQVQLEKGTDISRRRPRKKRRTVEGKGETVQKRTVRRDHPKVGRNEPCPCGSGKKYKKCCMGRELNA